MATRTLQPSEYEIQREVEALKDIRRRSQTPGALTIDPDLPNQSPQSSPTSTYRSAKSRSPTTADTSVNGTSEESVSSGESSGSGNSLDVANPNNPADDPFHLFWVPASVHPEIAPAEFRAFLKEHARNPATDSPDGSLERVTSLSSRSSLSRKRSMLSRQYQPREGEDSDSEDKIVPLRRNRSYAQHAVPQLTISDLQKLEELAEEASQNDDPSKLRSVLRRSLSMNLSPTAIGQMDGMPDMGDEADVPIIVPPPGQILRRAARTKIRKPGLPGENQPHRFGSGKRGRRISGGDVRTSVDQHSTDGQTSESEGTSSRRQTLSDDTHINNNRPDSFSEEASFIFDAYARDDDDDVHPPPVPPIPPLPKLDSSPPQPEEPIQPEIQPSLLEALGPILDFDSHQTDDLSQTLKQAPTSEPSRTPSPEPQPAEPALEPFVEVPQTQPPVFQPAPPSAIVQPSLQQQLSTPPPQPSPQHSPGRKEKDKKSLFKWGSDKSGKKGKGSEKEKEGFFGSLFGGGKKKQDESAPAVNTAGREAAHALLGASKSRSNVPPSSPGLAPGVNNFSRYPIHVERAIYRLSHIKLANPRRPLYEQVLISNLMFWYLGVINKAQNPTPAGSEGAAQAEKEKEQKEKEAKEKAEKERLERERLEKEREMEVKKKESGKRGSLTKSPPAGAPGGRRAEQPVKGPQYQMQQQVMQQEYSNGYGPPGNRGPNQPNGQSYPRNPSSPQMQQFPSQQQHPPQSNPYPPGSPYPPQQQQQMQPFPRQGQGQGSDQYYNDNSGGRGGLPPGAMPPANMAPQGGQSRPMSNIQQQQQPKRGYPEGMGAPNQQVRTPSRSLSANAVPSGGSPAPNTLRKGQSARAAVPNHGRPSEEEDVPLAVYQQQHRR